MPLLIVSGRSCGVTALTIAAEGRKAGVHLALSLQDPTHKSLDLRIRRNCLPLSFRVKDGDASRVVLGTSGAEQLRPRQFLTVMDRLVRGIAFAPADEEIRGFLADRPVSALGHLDWLPRQTTFSPAGEGQPIDNGEQIFETGQNQQEPVLGANRQLVQAGHGNQNQF